MSENPAINDAVHALNSLDPAQLEQRLAELGEEQSAVRVLLRAARARERERRQRQECEKEVANA